MTFQILFVSENKYVFSENIYLENESEARKCIFCFWKNAHASNNTCISRKSLYAI
jgi:hypothetical protein